MSDYIEDNVAGMAGIHDPETSKLAADLVDASKLMRIIYHEMTKFGDNGCIGDELFDALPDMDKWTIAPRFIQMINRGYIEKTGEKRRGHHNNRPQEVRRILHPPFKPKPKPKHTLANLTKEIELLSGILDSITRLKHHDGVIAVDDIIPILYEYQSYLDDK